MARTRSMIENLEKLSSLRLLSIQSNASGDLRPYLNDLPASRRLIADNGLKPRVSRI